MFDFDWVEYERRKSMEVRCGRCYRPISFCTCQFDVAMAEHIARQLAELENFPADAGGHLVMVVCPVCGTRNPALSTARPFTCFDCGTLLSFDLGEGR
jgi:hypothetical protein